MIGLWWVLCAVALVMGTFFAVVFVSQRFILGYVEALFHSLLMYAIAGLSAFLALSRSIRSWGDYLVAALFALEIAIRAFPAPKNAARGTRKNE